MVMRRPHIMLVLVGALVAMPAAAIVYTLQPGAGASDLQALLRPRTVLRDHVVCNGRNGDLEVSLIDLSFDEMQERLRRLLVGFPASGTAGSLLIEVPQTGTGRLRRYCIVTVGHARRTVMFKMDLDGPVDPHPRWPAELPAPVGAAAEQVIRLSKRTSLYASFRSPAPPASVQRSYAGQLAQAGWHRSGGDVYTRGRRMLVFSAIPVARGSLVCVYAKKLDIKAPR